MMAMRVERVGWGIFRLFVGRLDKFLMRTELCESGD